MALAACLLGRASLGRSVDLPEHQAAFKLLEEHVLAKNEEGHTFLLGERMSPVDVYLAFLYAWHNKQADLPGCTEITRRVATHEVIGPVWERNFRDRLDEKWHLM